MVAAYGPPLTSKFRVSSKECLYRALKYQQVQIIHALGINNELPKASVNYLPQPYFHDMASIYGSADLLITRSGAVTCSELSSLGKYSILIPLPHGNGEQFDNAAALVAQGSALSQRPGEEGCCSEGPPRWEAGATAGDPLDRR